MISRVTRPASRAATSAFAATAAAASTAAGPCAAAKAAAVYTHVPAMPSRMVHSGRSALSKAVINNDLPYPDGLSRLLNPVGYLKWKMNVIDSARLTYEVCAAQFEQQSALMKALGVEENFQGWFSMTILHVWMVNARLRGEGASGKDLKQEIFNHIWLDVELKLHQAGVKSNISKITENLLDSYYGQTLAYDEGLYYGDAVLGSALWRNFFGGRELDAAQLALLVDYTRRQLSHIEQAPFEEILEGRFQFLPN